MLSPIGLAGGLLTRQVRDRSKADLHLHSTCSDGLWAPDRVVELAARNGVVVLALTDHDTCEGLDEAARACARMGIELIPGVEISAEHSTGGERHLLAYGFDPSDAPLRRALEANRAARGERLHRILDALARAGIHLEPQDVLPLAHGAVGRPHVADALVRKGLVRSRQEAFDRWLADGKVGHVRKQNIDAERAIDIVHAAGGVVVLAHPGRRWSPALIEDLVRAGLDGLEVWHPANARPQARALEDMARRWDLLVTGGSDCHGDADGQESLRSLDVPVSVAEAVRARVAMRRRPAGAVR